MDITQLKKTIGKNTADITKVPNEFVGIVQSVETKADRQKTMCFYLNVALPSGEILTQKYTPVQVTHLVDNYLTELGIVDTTELIGKNIRFVKDSSRKGNPRWYPTKIVS